MFFSDVCFNSCYFQHGLYWSWSSVFWSGSVLCGSFTSDSPISPNPPFWSLSLDLVQIDVGFVVLKSWCNKLGIFDWIYRLLFSVAFIFLQGWTWSLFRSVYLKRLFFVKSSNASLFSAVFRHANLPVDLPSPTTVLSASHTCTLPICLHISLSRRTF